MATQLATTENSFQKLEIQIAERADKFKAALPAHITPEKFQRTIMTAVQSDPDLLLADRGSLITSCMKAAQDGLLPDKREAALVVFQTSVKDGQGKWNKIQQVQYMPMVYGLRKKILQSGEVKDIFANVVYRQEIEAGLFLYEEGSERMLRHKPLLDPEFEPSDDDIACAYSIATFEDGSQSFEVMRRSEINKVRQVSKTGALGKEYQGKPIPPKGPWVDWFSEMAKKTVMRRHSKVLPMSGDLLDVEAYDQAVAARASHAILTAVEPPPPARIEHVDPDTGEITDQHDDEEIARELDAQSSAAERGLNDDDGVVTSGDNGEPAWQAMVNDWIAALDGADASTIKRIDAELVKHMAGLPGEAVESVELAIREARAA